MNTEDGKKHRDLQRIAVELCARGFEWIQRYVDAVSLVKSLFGLATGKDEETPADLRSAASKAILQVAATNVQLFMATMAFDVLHTTSVNHRNATMRLVIFMVRRKPSVMHHSLPKLCEAIVHTLDPKDSSLRSTMQQTTTIIIGELVRTQVLVKKNPVCANCAHSFPTGTHRWHSIVTPKSWRVEQVKALFLSMTSRLLLCDAVPSNTRVHADHSL